MTEMIHGTVFAQHGAGCLIIGASGTGKSRIAEEALALGAQLVADDQVEIYAMRDFVMANAPTPLLGVIEFHGLGLIKVHNPLVKHMINLVLELDPTADERLPTVGSYTLLGKELPYLRVKPYPYTSAAAIGLYLKAMREGRVLPNDWHPNAA